jgi:hypothetical protein
LLLDEVAQATRARDEDLDAAAQRLLLRVLSVAAVDGRDPDAAYRGERRELAVDLRGELAGGREHEGARAAGPRPRHAGDERDFSAATRSAGTSRSSKVGTELLDRAASRAAVRCSLIGLAHVPERRQTSNEHRDGPILTHRAQT